MNGSQFGFLEAEFGEQFAEAQRAELYALADPRASVFYARRALELSVTWAFRHDTSLRQPYESNLNAYLSERSFQAVGGERVVELARKIQRAGNRAVHEAKAPSKLDAVEVVSALFQFSFWFAYTYGRATKPDLALRFDPHLLARTAARDEGASTAKALREKEAELDQVAEEQRLAQARLHEELRGRETLEAELAKLRAEVAAAKKLAAETPVEAHDWSEAATRTYLIDGLLAEAGWALDDERDREFRVTGMPEGSGVGYVDYVLWGDDGRPLGLVEAKRTTVDATEGQEQAKRYADCLEEMFGRRPVIFYSNGYDHWMWDDAGGYPPRRVAGFRTKDELALIVQRRSTQSSLQAVTVNPAIVGRFYQERAIRAIAESFEHDKSRKALVVMATGAGKTRTVIALTDLLMRAGWVKRVLFLVDRKALVKQAVDAFKLHLPDSAPVNLVTEKHKDSRVYVSTYQTMVGLIDEFDTDGVRRFGPGHFDLVVIDEAHRSVYRKYRGIFEYFDSLLVGLTATPKDEVAKNTYDLFDLETGVPTDVYSLEEAINDGYLVAPRGVSVPLEFIREGITYRELSADEQAEWEELDWGADEDGDDLDPPAAVDAAELNKWLFNTDTVDKALEHLMTNGIKVAGGDRLGKTIIFAKNQHHADFIYERFIANYPALDAGNFARVITNKVKFTQSLIDDFSVPERSPHIAISVDMLDTGIDVPECVNLMFFKLVRSRTKFWQMIGRGTRLRPDLFGPGDHKTHFNVFDFCQNLEYFSEDMATAEPTDSPSLGERLFSTRLELIGQLDTDRVHTEERHGIAELLQVEVASMNAENFLVRPHRRLVDRYRELDAWETVTLVDLGELTGSLAPLPTQTDPEPEDAKRFDLLLLSTQLGVLRGDPIAREQARITTIAGLLEDQQAIPAIARQLALIFEVQTDEWWVDVTHPMLEEVRTSLRLLVPLIEKSKKATVYTNFADTLGEGTEIELPGTGGSAGSAEFAQFRKKAAAFLADHLADAAVAKVRSGEPLTVADIEELQRILVAAGVGTDEDFAAASEAAGSLGLFIREIVGLDQSAAKATFNDFLDDKRYTKNQIEFVNLVINYLTEHGVLDPARVYESPFISVAPTGPDDLFHPEDVRRLFAAIEALEVAASP